MNKRKYILLDIFITLHHKQIAPYRKTRINKEIHLAFPDKLGARPGLFSETVSTDIAK